MNQADILKLAEEARVDYFTNSYPVVTNLVITNLPAIFRFAELVSQHERQAGRIEAIQACRECYSPDDTAADWDLKMVDLQTGILMQQSNQRKDKS